MLGTILRPWRTPGATWRLFVSAVVGIPFGPLAGGVTFGLLAATAGTAVALPIAIVPLVAALVWSRFVSQLDRGRFEVLHGVSLPDPVAPLPRGSLWARFKAAVSSGDRWRLVGHCLLRMPAGIAVGTITIVSWSWSIALALLPLYVWAFPSGTARFWLFDVSTGPLAFVLAAAGIVGVVAVAPWVTVTLARLDLGLARWLLAPRRDVELAEQVARAETGRAAAVDAAEAERRRIERDLHDGAQQRLVALAMDLGAARERFDTDPDGARRMVEEAHEESKAALREIRDLVRGIHPVILEDRGLDAALSAVVARSPVPVDLDVDLPAGRRPPPAVESTAYFVVSEALANVARHAGATRAKVAIAGTGERLVVEVRDDGAGGADPAKGTGLAGLRERVTGMGGTLDLLSPLGGPTTLLVELPCAS